jgi:hypothetical protein
MTMTGRIRTAPDACVTCVACVEGFEDVRAASVAR